MVCLAEVETVLMKNLSFKEGDRKVMRSFSFKKGESESLTMPKQANKIVLEQSPSFKNWELEKKLEVNLSFNSQSLQSSQFGCAASNKVDHEDVAAATEKPLFQLVSPRPTSQLDEYATKLQKVYKSYRTRRNLADAVVIAEELWWHALDFASLNIYSVSFYHDGKPEKPGSRWSRAKRRLAKVGRGLSENQKAQKLAIQHWLEAIDPRHRYGHNLNIYYDVWRRSASTQPFFHWLDIGDGRKCDLDNCPRSRLQSQIITYLGPIERESYEVIVVEGLLKYKKEQTPVNTTEGSKWIFVLSTCRTLYVGKKKKGNFQHSSFLAGAATTAAGRLVVKDGYLKAVWPYSGHYRPTDENFSEFVNFLTDNRVDLSNVVLRAADDDEIPSFGKPDNFEIAPATTCGVEAGGVTPKWSNGAGARIGCARDYPVDLQHKALEHVRLSPRAHPSSVEYQIPIPSPRPSPKMRISPHVTRMGFSPRPYAADLHVVNGSPKVVLASPRRNKIPTPSPRRSPMVKLSPRTSFTGFPSPKVTLRLPSLKNKRFH